MHFVRTFSIMRAYGASGLLLSKRFEIMEKLHSLHQKHFRKWLVAGYIQWWDSAGSHRFYRTVSGNFITTANRLALLLIVVPLVETELADNIQLLK